MHLLLSVPNSDAAPLSSTQASHPTSHSRRFRAVKQITTHRKKLKCIIGDLPLTNHSVFQLQYRVQSSSKHVTGCEQELRPYYTATTHVVRIMYATLWWATPPLAAAPSCFTTGIFDMLDKS